MISRRAALFTSLLTALLVPTLASAQRIAGGPYAPVVLFLPANTRLLAFGNTGVASRDDPLFYNPAQLVVGRGVSASFERFSSSSAGGSFSSITQFHGGGIGVGMSMVDYDAPNNTFPGDRNTLLAHGPGGGTPIEAAVGIGQVIKGLRVGAVAKYVEENVPAQHIGRAAFDLGIAKDLARIYTVGLAVQNIGSSMSVPCSLIPVSQQAPCTGGDESPPPSQTTNVHLPLRTTLGVSTGRDLGELDVSATAALSLIRSNFLIPSGGAEVSYSWLDGYDIALRAGGRRPVPGEGEFTAGAGFTMDRFTIDYALETLAGSRVGHRVGLRIR